MHLTCAANNWHETFTLNHADMCSKGGVVHRRHDYIKLILAHHAEKAFGCNPVQVEPMLGHVDDANADILTGNLNDNARADLAIRDFKRLRNLNSLMFAFCHKYAN